MSSRSWFASLSTREQQTAACAITDRAFLRLFLDLLSRSDKEGNVPLSLQEIIALLGRGHLANCQLIHNKAFSNSSIGIPSASDQGSAAIAPPMSLIKESKPDTSCADAPTNEASLSNSSASEKDTPASPSSQENLNKLLGMLMSHVYVLLPSVFSPEACEVGVWLKTGNLSKKKGKGKLEQNDENREKLLEDGLIAALTLDPIILGASGESNLFYKWADEIVGLMTEGCDEQKDQDVARFLMNGGSGEWPAWLVHGCNADKQLPLGLILLAGFEMSINSKRQRLAIGNVMVHIGGETSLHTVWNSHPGSSDYGVSTVPAGEIERVFRVRKMLMEGGKKVKSILSDEEWSELESRFKSFDGRFKVENIFVTPLQLIADSPLAQQSCQSLNSLSVEVFSKLFKSLSIGPQRKNHTHEECKTDDVDVVEDAALVSKKKKKSKPKKKGKKSSSTNECYSTEQENQLERAETSKPPAQIKEAPFSKSSLNGGSPIKAPRSVESEEKSGEATEPAKLTSDEKKPETDLSDSINEGEVLAKEEESKSNDDADEWETVAVKTRKSKVKQSNDQSNVSKFNSGNRSSQSGRNGNNNSSSNGDGGNNRRRDRKKSKKDREKDRGRRNQASSQTIVVKDVLTHILDAVDDEVSRRGKQGAKSVSSDDKRRQSNNSASANSNRNNNEQRRKVAAAPVVSALPLPNSSWGQQPRSLRDIVAGIASAPVKNEVKPANNDQSEARPAPVEPFRSAKIKPGLSYKSVIDTHQQPVVVTPTTTNEAKASEKKDTAKSRASSAIGTKKGLLSSSVHGTSQSSMNIAYAKETAPKEDLCQSPPSTTEDDRNTPPLSTLLGPGTSCSATSSVASSLEAPHSSRFRHQSISSTEDVGVHLLNVCKQLSEEIDTFMSRRSLALDIRRKERSAVLSALQDTVVKIWPGNCHVEMYGSCATQLDLPSSDLDLVVCGLDEMMMNHIPINPTTGSILQSPTNSLHDLHSPSPSGSAQNLQHQHSLENSSQQLHRSFESSDHTMQPSPGDVSIEQQQTHSQQNLNASMAESNLNEATEFVPEGEAGTVYDASEEDVTMMESYAADYHGQEYYYVPYNYIPPMSLNAQRVIRLASELEMQPWAVQVKAIPTAAVPVVKILADPSKLPGAVGTGDNWMMQQHIAAQAGAPGTPPMSPTQISATPSQFSSSSHFFSQHPMPPWRGADIMNGLQPVDITFEGPEHGGIGSTTFSTCVVQDSCNKTGLSPEKTPVVQVKMVLKELLAQRRLNEPFTGGLSSYALLLLLLAVVKERQIIQDEMERVEKQRQEVNQQDARENKPIQKQCSGPSRLSAAQIVAREGTSSKPPTSKMGESSVAANSSESAVATKEPVTPKAIPKQVSSSSWASIAKKSNGSTARTDSMSTATISNSSSLVAKKPRSEKNKVLQSSITEEKKHVSSKNSAPTPTLAQSGSTANSAETESEPTQSKIANTILQSKNTADGQVPPLTEEEIKPPTIPECSNDVLEVLCSGDMSSGKLLMHFLLFYGQHFDAQSTLIDVNGTHHPEYGTSDLAKLSPFVTRPPGGNIDPVTGMYSVDPIVVYDPLEGAMDHNVAKRCYCWNNIKWVFAQSYMTVSSIVETSGTSSNAAAKERHRKDKKTNGTAGAKKSGADEAASNEPSRVTGDIISPILELLLSF